jgi:hypothetical protein
MGSGRWLAVSQPSGLGWLRAQSAWSPGPPGARIAGCRQQRRFRCPNDDIRVHGRLHAELRRSGATTGDRDTGRTSTMKLSKAGHGESRGRLTGTPHRSAAGADHHWAIHRPRSRRHLGTSPTQPPGPHCDTVASYRLVPGGSAAFCRPGIHAVCVGQDHRRAAAWSPGAFPFCCQSANRNHRPAAHVSGAAGRCATAVYSYAQPAARLTAAMISVCATKGFAGGGGRARR